jgi:large subunit ribosomal protein L37Ae
MGNTVKVGTSGRFSSRYGVGVRKRVVAVENKMNLDIACPFCGFSKTKREAAGLFDCKKCGAKFTGGAYEPQTLVGKTINKMVSQKQFLAGAEELVKAKESSFSDIEREVEKSLTGDVVEEEPRVKEKKGKKSKKAKEDVSDTIVESSGDESGEAN